MLYCLSDGNILVRRGTEENPATWGINNDRNFWQINTRGGGYMSFKAKSRTTYGSEFGFPIHPLQRQSYETPSSSSFVLPSFDDIRTAGKRPLAVMEQPEKKKRTFTSITPAVKPAVLKVCGYARVSTESESQKSSIDIQQQHLMTLASSNDDWEWQGIYCDIISGTRMEKRPELQRMLRDCREGKINFAVCAQYN